jgi:hypothetical protein
MRRTSAARQSGWVVSSWLGLCCGLLAAEPTTEVEEVVATCQPPGNGAGPLWCYGAPLVVRQGDRVFASVTETGAGVSPPCNTRWRLYRRDAGGWQEVRHAGDFREREPCPLASPGPGSLMISVNPSTKPPGTPYGRCDPHLLLVDTLHPDQPPTALRPLWSGAPHFSVHSYRGLAVDASRGDVLVLNIDAETSDQRWNYRPGDGTPSRDGTVRFPIRACYPQVAIRDRSAHVLAIGDIVEPNETWRAYKKQTTGSEWDYVFRRLFYARSPDISRDDFDPPIEVDGVEATGGHIANLDLWLDRRGVAHLLYLKTNTLPLLRDRFFPGQKVATTLEHVEVERGSVTRRTTLVGGGEGKAEAPQYARFHAAGDGTLWVVYAATVWDGKGSSRLENRLIRVSPRPPGHHPVRLALVEPFTTFFTATERGGSPASDVLDLFGTGRDPATLRYARIRLR